MSLIVSPRYSMAERNARSIFIFRAIFVDVKAFGGILNFNEYGINQQNQGS